MTATIEPIGQRTLVPRDHLIKLVLELGAAGGKHADKADVAASARRALEAFPAAKGHPDRRGFTDVLVTNKAKRAGSPPTIVVGVEATLVWSGRPTVIAVEKLRTTLLEEGFRITLFEKRECGEADCSSETMVEWDRLSVVPWGWYSSVICGRHDYRLCSGCKSLYVFSSTNSAGQAPSLHCEVCGAVMIEWGRSKTWTAELVTRGTAASS